MFNPFAKFENKFIGLFRKQKIRYLVAQTFFRDNDLFKEKDTVSLLLSHYADLMQAKTHVNALAGDKYASIVDIENETHRTRIETILKDEKFHVYSSMVIDVKVIKDAMDKIFSDKIKNYISRKTTWRIGSNKTIVPTLEITFGELFVVLKYAGETIRVTLEEIERH